MKFFNFLFLSPSKRFLLKLNSLLSEKDYDGIYLLHTLFIFLNILYTFQKFPIILFIILPFALLLIILQLLIFISIQKNYKPSDYYYWLLTKWAFFLFISFFFISLSFVNYINETFFLFAILFLGIFPTYFLIRFLLYKWITHWISYLLILLLTPLPIAFTWLLIGMILEYPFFNDSLVLMGATIIFSIAFMNLIVFWTPFSRLDEVRVAIYFLLGIFSTISYLFFIADIATYFLRDFIMSLNQITIPTETMRNDIDILIKWVTLPYLIGSVLCCFSIELVTRNYNRENKGT